MNTRKIWILAIVFGLIMSFLFFILTIESSKPSDQTIEQVREEEEAKEKESPTDKLTIEVGKRAITIDVDEVQSVSGFVKPGSFVDIISVFDDGISQIILQNVKVIAVGNLLAEEEIEDPYNRITFELAPEEGAALALANQHAFITLMLRGAQDDDSTPQVPLSLEHIKKGQKPT